MDKGTTRRFARDVGLLFDFGNTQSLHHRRSLHVRGSSGRPLNDAYRSLRQRWSILGRRLGHMAEDVQTSHHLLP